MTDYFINLAIFTADLKLNYQIGFCLRHDNISDVIASRLVDSGMILLSMSICQWNATFERIDLELLNKALKLVGKSTQRVNFNNLGLTEEEKMAYTTKIRQISPTAQITVM